MTNRPDQAVILSGGGANGAYEIGVLEALFEKDAGFAPGIYTGTSVGAFNAAFMASPRKSESPAATVARLQKVWTGTIAAHPENGGNGVFRVRADPLPFLSPSYLAKHPTEPFTELVRDGLFLAGDTFARAVYFGRQLTRSIPRDLGELLQVPDLSSFISVAPLEELIRSNIDLERLRDSEVDFRCVATDWTHGKPEMFTRDEMSDAEGHKIIQASASIPALFPEVVIGGIHYVDGGVTMNTPLDPAIDAWRANPERTAELEVHVIYLEPALADMPLPEVSSTLKVTTRLVLTLLAYNANTHIESAARKNPVIRAQLEEAGFDGSKTHEPGSGKALAEPILRIHRYRQRPTAEEAGGLPGLLEFTTEHIDELIEAGRGDGRGHDCLEEGCITPA